MNKIVNQKTQDKQILKILKKLASRMEDATIDISSIKSDLKFVNLRLNGVKHNTEIVKVDMESIKVGMGNLKGEMKEMEVRLGKRITSVADLITVSLDQKFGKMEKRVKKLEVSSRLNN